MGDNVTITNDPRRAGQTAERQELIGHWGRYAVAPVHTRFTAVSWFVWDADTPDEDGHPSVIRQANTRAEAVAGLV
jgi:hypothetical protein